MEFSDFLTGYVCEGSFLFDGLIFGFGLQGDLLFKLNYTEFRISSGGFFCCFATSAFFCCILFA